MANEGFLGKHTIGGEKASTNDHPPVIWHLPLSEAAKAAPIPVGTVMKRVDGDDGAVFWEPMLAADEADPVAVVESPCDPTGESAETSAFCIVHGGVKVRLLKTGDGKDLTEAQIAQLCEHGIFAV